MFYVADMRTAGLWEIDTRSFRRLGFLPTGKGVHGLYVSRDPRFLYASNRGEGTISACASTRSPAGTPSATPASSDSRRR